MYTNKAELISNNNQALDGLDKHLSNVKSMPIFGVPTPLSEVKAVLRAAVALQARVAAARAQWKEVIAEARSANAAALRMRRAIKAYLVVHHGDDAEAVLVDFGFDRKPRAQSVRTKAAAVDKRLETRELRHTMGKRQKALIRAPSLPPPAPAPSNGAPQNGAVNGAPQNGAANGTA
jgi:hypothetical protein